MGIIMTTLLGIAGSFLGGYLGHMLHGGEMDVAQTGRLDRLDHRRGAPALGVRLLEKEDGIARRRLLVAEPCDRNSGAR